MRVVALAESGTVRKDVTAAYCLDHASFAAGVTRQTCVRHRVDVFGAHAFPGRELCRCLRRTGVGSARQGVGHVCCGEFAFERLARTQGMALLDLVGIGEAARDDEVLQAYRPFLVVGARKI